MSSRQSISLPRTVGTPGVFVAGVGLVVAASTLVTDFAGFASLGWGFAIALCLAFGIMVPLAISVAHLSVAHPRAGGIYHFARAIIGGRRGAFVGVFLGLCFFGMFLFGASGETTAGAYALRSLVGSSLPVEFFVVVLAAVALVPNLFGVRAAAGITGLLLVIMLGLRWWFGLAGFFGWSNAGEWRAANLMPAGGLEWFGPTGIVSCGLALGFWTFVGIEGAAALAEDTKNPARSIPRGMLLGLVAILLTSLVMGLGATGTQPLATWSAAVAGPLGHDGESPQLAFGAAMFGAAGRHLMAIASLAATLSTLTVAFAAVPRMIYGIARDGWFFGPLSPVIARLHPRTNVPRNATLLVVGIYLALAVCTGAVLDCLYSAAYLWIFRYIVLHAFALVQSRRQSRGSAAPAKRWLAPLAAAGILGALAAFYFGFAGKHLLYAPRAGVVTLGALLIAGVSFGLSRRTRREPAIALVPGVTAPLPPIRAGAAPTPALVRRARAA